jgi:hypothetical protein
MMIDQKYLALWGAILSTILGLVKLYELWASRRIIEITCYFDGRPEVGNDVIIRNISDKQLIVTYWQLSFCKRKNLHWEEYNTEEPNEDAADIIIPPHSSRKLNNHRLEVGGFKIAD